MRYADETGKAVALALLVSGPDHLFEVPDHMTFLQEGRGALREAVERLEETFSSFSSFREVTIFIYEFYQGLGP